MRGYVKRVSQKASKLSNEQLISILNDITDENEILYSIFDSISTGILIVNNDFILQQYNSILESQLPLFHHLDDSKSQNAAIWELIDDNEISNFFQKCKKTMLTNASEEFSFSSSDRIKYINITMMPFNNNGQLVGRIFLIQDVTQNKTQEILLHRMENLSNLTNLAAGMAHEIKNPLGAISIHIQLIQKALDKARGNNDILPPKKFVEDHIDVVNEEIEHLNSLVMDFLFAVRPINAKLELKSPDVVIEKVVNFFKPEFNKENILINYSSKSKDQKVMIDEKLLRDVIVNFAHNALAAIKEKFSQCDASSKIKDENDFPGKFMIESAIAENKYVLRISDNGCGMSAETISKIFEPYYTTKANGTGLGMTMVYKIIKEFSGEISVHSELNEGTSFIIILPLPQVNKKLLSKNI